MLLLGAEIDMADYETSLKYFADDVLYEDMIYRCEAWAETCASCLPEGSSLYLVLQ